ncbi:hypothetical protein F0U44_15840 [Nocardioides humilatus]|uniref:Uncharacterized protein n=1 Tax=Nocardioides humilatus TaxID=2607660 RepID=A0A5B1LAJ2_9ACTN|nr:GerMN domain-containing protein [Nocardioides humilatus]KAA1417761.1 hypothetical protein F0U44_15840 [Nocardioides humilatus]
MSDLSPDRRDDELRALLHDAVSDVEPADRLGEVRRRTRTRPTRSRRWAPLLVGAGAVAATVVTAGIVVNTLGDEQSPEDTPVASSGPGDGPTTAAAGIYYLGSTTAGPRLYREFQAVGRTSDPSEKVLNALQRLTVDTGPRDPDYDTLWPKGSFAGVEVTDDRVVVALGTPAALTSTETTALGRYGVQQAVYTAEAALGATLPVAFVWDGAPARTVLGVKVAALVDRDRNHDIAAPVNITDPSEHLAVTGVLEANGTMADDVARVSWILYSNAPDEVVVRQGRATPIDITGPDARATLGAPGWETGVIDLAGLEPGTYTFVVSVSEVGQTSDDYPDVFEDTRTITVR